MNDSPTQDQVDMHEVDLGKDVDYVSQIFHLLWNLRKSWLYVVDAKTHCLHKSERKMCKTRLKRLGL